MGQVPAGQGQPAGGDVAGGRLQQPGQQAQESGLAAAVEAPHHQEAARGQVQVHAPEERGRPPGKGEGEVLGAQAAGVGRGLFPVPALGGQGLQFVQPGPGRGGLGQQGAGRSQAHHPLHRIAAQDGRADEGGEGQLAAHHQHRAHGVHPHPHREPGGPGHGLAQAAGVGDAPAQGGQPGGLPAPQRAVVAQGREGAQGVRRGVGREHEPAVLGAGRGQVAGGVALAAHRVLGGPQGQDHAQEHHQGDEGRQGPGRGHEEQGKGGVQQGHQVGAVMGGAHGLQVLGRLHRPARGQGLQGVHPGAGQAGEQGLGRSPLPGRPHLGGQGHPHPGQAVLHGQGHQGAAGEHQERGVEPVGQVAAQQDHDEDGVRKGQQVDEQAGHGELQEEGGPGPQAGEQFVHARRVGLASQGGPARKGLFRRDARPIPPGSQASGRKKGRPPGEDAPALRMRCLPS